MPMTRKKPAVHPGSGELRFPGYRGPVRYEIEGEISQLRGQTRLRGAIFTTPEIAAEAFREGDGFMRLDETGAEYRLKLLAHTDGGEVVYFEMRP